MSDRDLDVYDKNDMIVTTGRDLQENNLVRVEIEEEKKSHDEEEHSSIEKSKVFSEDKDLSLQEVDHILDNEVFKKNIDSSPEMGIASRPEGYGFEDLAKPRNDTKEFKATGLGSCEEGSSIGSKILTGGEVSAKNRFRTIFETKPKETITVRDHADLSDNEIRQREGLKIKGNFKTLKGFMRENSKESVEGVQKFRSIFSKDFSGVVNGMMETNEDRRDFLGLSTKKACHSGSTLQPFLTS